VWLSLQGLGVAFYKNPSYSDCTFRFFHSFYSVNYYPVRKLFLSFLSYTNGMHCDGIWVLFILWRMFHFILQLDLFLFSFYTYSAKVVGYCICVSWVQKRLLLLLSLLLLLLLLSQIALQGMHFGFSILNEKQCPLQIIWKGMELKITKIYILEYIFEILQGVLFESNKLYNS